MWCAVNDDERNYHSSSALVYVGNWPLEIPAIWDGIQRAEDARISLDQISGALNTNWSACVVALARGNVAVLRALIDEAAS